MWTIIFLFIACMGLMLIPKYVIAPKYGDDVRSRFIEHMNYIPSQDPDLLSRTTLARWLSDSKNSGAVSGYVFPILFPFDILFLVSLGLLLGFTCVALAGTFGFLSNVPARIWWVLPLGYVMADIAEDTAIAAILKKRVDLTDGSFGLLTALTKIKLATIGLALGQVGFLGALYALLSFFPAGRPS